MIAPEACTGLSQCATHLALPAKNQQKMPAPYAQCLANSLARFDLRLALSQLASQTSTRMRDLMRRNARKVLREEQLTRIHYGLHDIGHLCRILGDRQH